MVTKEDLWRIIPALAPKTRTAETCVFHEQAGALDVKHKGTMYLIPLEHYQIWELHERTGKWLRNNTKSKRTR